MAETQTIFAVPTDAGRQGADIIERDPTPTPAALLNLLSAVTDGSLALILTFDRPLHPGEALVPGHYSVAPTGAGAAVAVASAALVDPAPGDLPNQVRLTLAFQGTGTEDYDVKVVGLLGACGEALGVDTASFVAVAVAPRVIDAIALEPTEILVRFTLAMGVSVEDPTHVAVTFDSGSLTVDSVDHDDDEVVVILDAGTPMVAGTEYEVAWSAVFDAADNAIDPAHASAVVTAPLVLAADEPQLQAATAAIGAAISELIGTPTTVLTTQLIPGDSAAEVESTLFFSDSGFFRIGDLSVGYTSRSTYALLGLTWHTLDVQPFDPGTPVEDANRQWSTVDCLWSEAGILTCPDDALDEVVADYGYPRLLAQIPTADLRQYAQTLHYLDRGTWWSCFRVLRWMFRWAALRGTGNLVGSDLTIPSAGVPNLGTLHDRWILVGADLSRIINAEVVGANVVIHLETGAGPFWGLIDNSGTVSYEIPAFRFEHTKRAPYPLKCGYFRVILYVSDPALVGTYIVESGLSSAAGVPRRGKLSTDWETAGYADAEGGFQNLYLRNAFADETLAVLADIVPAGTEVQVTSLAS